MRKSHIVFVKMEEDKWYQGISDLQDTYCCSATCMIFVTFPDIPNDDGHYFVKSKVKVID